MSNPGTPTLDQLQIFLAVVDVGSFAGAARKLGRATSVISYSITNLEAQLGVVLFDRCSTKKPLLTEAGKTVLAEARSVSHGIDRLRANVKGIVQGLESEIHLVLDMMLPAARVTDVLKSFQHEFPTVALRIRTEGLGAVTQVVLDGLATIGVCGPPDTEIDGLQRLGVGSVDLIPVAAPDHPLAKLVAGFPGAPRDFVQIVLTDRSARTQGRDLGVMGMRTWRVHDLTTKHLLLKEGMGWGTMPLPMVREDLQAGRLVHLHLPDFKGGPYRFFAIYKTDNPPGPAGQFILSRFARQVLQPHKVEDAHHELENSVRELSERRTTLSAP
jgi:DNA-binding transcriptional LysR family regulator